MHSGIKTIKNERGAVLVESFWRAKEDEREKCLAAHKSLLRTAAAHWRKKRLSSDKPSARAHIVIQRLGFECVFVALQRRFIHHPSVCVYAPVRLCVSLML